MDCQFSFGANGSYLFRAGSNIAWSDNLIPHRLEHLLENKSQTFGNMYDVAFPIEEGLYMASWYTNTEEDRYEDAFLGPNYARLARFMAQVAKNSGHTMQTVFGPNYSYFSFSTSGYSWQNIPPALENDILNSMKTRLPTAVALGLEASYVVVYSDGTVSADLNGYYPALESLISDGSKEATRSAMTYVALNPQVPSEFYAVNANGEIFSDFPEAWENDVSTVNEEIQHVAAKSSETAEEQHPVGEESIDWDENFDRMKERFNGFKEEFHKMSWEQRIELVGGVISAANDVGDMVGGGS